jgi:hypothetical protein
MGLLDGDLKAIIGGAVADLFLSATLTKRTTSGSRYDPTLATGTSYTCKAIREEYSERFRLDGTVKRGDVKVLVTAASLSVEPEAGDTITVSGDKERTIVAVASDPAGATWELQARG